MFQNFPQLMLKITNVMAIDWHIKNSQEATWLRPFYTVHDKLAVSNNLVIYLYDQGPARLVISEVLRDKIAANLQLSMQPSINISLNG